MLGLNLGIAMPLPREVAMFQKQLISKKELKSVAGIPYSPAHIQRLENAGLFPKRVKLGKNRVAWLMEEVEAWIDERIAQRDVAEEALDAL